MFDWSRRSRSRFMPAIGRWCLLAAMGLLASTTAPAADTAQIDSRRIDAALKSLTDSHALVGVSALVYANGKERYSGAFGLADREAGRPMSRDTVVQIFSMTKPITGVAFMQMYEQGKFGLDDPLEKYLPEFGRMRIYAGVDAQGQVLYRPVERSITVRDITRHTAGFWNGTPEDRSVLGEIVRAAEPGAKTNTLSQEAGKLASLPLLFEPGTRWLYGPSVDLQALMVERLSGVPFDRYIAEHIFKPLGMTHTGYVPNAADRANLAALYEWHEHAAMTRMPDEKAFEFNSKEWPLKPGSFGLVSTLDDYMRFARMLLNGGVLDGARLLKPETVRLMATDALPAGLSDVSWLPSKGSVGFGIDFAVRTRRPASAAEASGAVGEFFWDGAADTLFWVDPRNQIAAVLFTQYVPFGKVALHKAFRDAVYAHVPEALAR
jgi:CubicO group peptidase (beta-lactamase class C family)